MTVRIVVVDDQEMYRLGFRAVLESLPELEVVGEADDGDTAVELLRTVQADVVLMDVRMPRMDGVEATRRIRASGGPKVLVLTTFDLDEYAYDALEAGASGFLLKNATLKELSAATPSWTRPPPAGSSTASPVATPVRRPPARRAVGGRTVRSRPGFPRPRPDERARARTSGDAAPGRAVLAGDHRSSHASLRVSGRCWC